MFNHEKKMNHMDIKPPNILVRRTPDKDLLWRVYLTDFGISLFWADDPGVTIGPGAKIPFYCAPEVAQHEPARRSADIFSLGGVFLEILTVYSNSTIEDLHQWIAGPYWKAIVPAPGIYTLELSLKETDQSLKVLQTLGKLQIGSRGHCSLL